MISREKKLFSVAVVAFAIPVSVYLLVQGIKYRSQATANPVTISFSQNTLSLNKTTPTSVNLVLNASTNQIGFATATFTFDKTKVNLANPVTISPSLKKDGAIILTNPVDANTTGSVTIVLGLDPADRANPPTGSFNLATLQFIEVGTDTTPSSLNFTANTAEVVDMSASDLAITTTNSTINFTSAIGTPSPTASTTPSQLGMKLKFQGITGPSAQNKIPTITFKQGSTVVYTTNNYPFSYSNGIYTGSIPSQPGGTYDIYVKSASFLQKKFTGISFTNTLPTTLDLTSSALKAGDFDDNNQLDISDLGLILAQYTALSTPVNTSNAKYDINNDGVIDITDIALVLSNYTTLVTLGD